MLPGPFMCFAKWRKFATKNIAALPWVEARNLLKLGYNRKIQLSRGLKGVIPSHGTNRRFWSGIPTPSPRRRSAQNGANFCGKTPLTKAEHEFLLYDDV